MFQFYVQAFLACLCLRFVCCDLFIPFLCLFSLTDHKIICSIHAMNGTMLLFKLPWAMLKSCDFMILWDFIFDENMYTSNLHFCCSKLLGSEKWNQVWHLGRSATGLHQTPGLAQCFQCQADSSASRLVKRWRHQAPGTRHHTEVLVCKQFHISELAPMTND